MDLVVLGAQGTWPSAGGATSGLLVRHEELNLVLDMGTGTMAKLQEQADPFDIGAVFISHSHPDHVSDLYAYLLARLFSPERPERIPLYLAPKVLERFTPLLADDSGEMDLHQAFDVRIVEVGAAIELGPYRITTVSMRHTVPTFGMRVEADGSALAYSADTGPTDELTTLAAGADLLVAEASWQEDGVPRPPIHLTAREAGEAATRAGAGRLVLNHLRPYLDRDRSREEAAGSFGGDILVGGEGRMLEVG